MAAWSEKECEKLSELASYGMSCAMVAKALKRSASSVSTKASKSGVRFDSLRHSELITLMDKGGNIAREDLGGVIGIRWFPAHRSGGSFDASFCEKLLEFGVLEEVRQGVFQRAQT